MIFRLLLDEIEGHFLFREDIHAVHKFLEAVKKMAAMKVTEGGYGKKEGYREQLKAYYSHNYFKIAESRHISDKDKKFIKDEIDPDAKIEIAAKEKMKQAERRVEMSVQQIITTYVHRHKGELMKDFLGRKNKKIEGWQLAKEFAPKVKLDIQLLYPKIHNRKEMEWVEDPGQQQTIESDIGIFFRSLSGLAASCGITIKGSGKAFVNRMYDSIMVLLRGEEMALRPTG